MNSDNKESEKKRSLRKTEIDKKVLYSALCKEIDKRREKYQKKDENKPQKQVRDGIYAHILAEFAERTEPEFKHAKNMKEDYLRLIYHRYKKNEKKEKEPVDSAILKPKCGRRPYFYPWEQLIIMYFLRLCIEYFIFPMKKELVGYFNDILKQKKNPPTVTWRYVRYWLRKNGFSYKELRKSNFHQFNSQSFTDKINNYFYELYSEIYSAVDSKNDYKIIFEDESGFKDFVSSKSLNLFFF